jgi:hypothetical protein
MEIRLSGSKWFFTAGSSYDPNHHPSEFCVAWWYLRTRHCAFGQARGSLKATRCPAALRSFTRHLNPPNPRDLSLAGITRRHCDWDLSIERYCFCPVLLFCSGHLAQLVCAVLWRTSQPPERMVRESSAMPSCRHLSKSGAVHKIQSAPTSDADLSPSLSHTGAVIIRKRDRNHRHCHRPNPYQGNLAICG